MQHGISVDHGPNAAADSTDFNRTTRRSDSDVPVRWVCIEDARLGLNVVQPDEARPVRRNHPPLASHRPIMREGIG